MGELGDPIFYHMPRKRFPMSDIVWNLVLVLGLVAGWSGWVLAVEKKAESSPPKEQPFHYDPGEHRDPFVPLVQHGVLVGAQGPHQASAQPVLHGILWDPAGHSIALVNDAEAKVGETVDGYQIMEIRKDAVVVSDGEEPVVLQLQFDTRPPKKGSSGTTKGGEEP